MLKFATTKLKFQVILHNRIILKKDSVQEIFIATLQAKLNLVTYTLWICCSPVACM